MKKYIFVVFVIVAMLMASCAPAAAPAAEEPEAPAAEEPEAPAAEEPEAPAESAEEAPTCTPVECEETPVEARPVADVEAVCAADEFGCAKIEPGQTVKIGMSAPMSGGDASFGIDAQNSGQLAAADACPFAGFSFEVLNEDDAGTAEGGAAVANKFVADQTVVAVAGHQFSGASFAAEPIYAAAGIPMLSPSATNPGLTEMGSKVFNRVPFTDKTQAEVISDYMYNTMGIRKLALMHDSQDYGKGLAELTQTAFTALGGEVVELIGVTTKEADYSPVLSTIAAKSPDAIYFGGYTQDGSVIANQMKTTGLENAAFVGCDGTYGVDFVNRAGANAEGTIHTVPRAVEASEAQARLDACYLEKAGKPVFELSPYSYNNYDAPMALIESVKQVALLGDDGSLYVPRGALVTTVRGLKDYKGVGNVITCNEVGECNALGMIIMKVVDGEFVPQN